AGTPKTAITASPMNFSTVPPWASTMPRIRSKYRASSARSASGSVDSPRSVDPVTSQKSAVTALRCSWSVPPSVAPQKGQNGNSPGRSLPQEGQPATARVYDEGVAARNLAYNTLSERQRRMGGTGLEPVTPSLSIRLRKRQSGGCQSQNACTDADSL